METDNCEIYRSTNESLIAIQKGLNPSEGDNIYAILGSGDQTFMMLEKGANVFGIDRNKGQVKYVKDRISALKRGRIEDFIVEKDLRKTKASYSLNFKSRNSYIAEMDLDELKRNLGNLKLIVANISKKNLNFSVFNKVYLSNALQFDLNALKNFTQKFSQGTLFYFASPRYKGPLKIGDPCFFNRNEELSEEVSSFENSWISNLFVKN